MSEKYPLALPEGSVLAGEYVIEKILGQGGFGITYKAKDHKTGRYVAVKEFFPDSMATRANTSVVPYTGDREDNYLYGKECFLQEAETLAKFIGNENIVRVYSYFEENGTAYFVMEYIEGTSFDMYIKQQGGKVSFDEAYRILSPVMDALAAVHGRGIIHRDVTPDNIYITNDGTVKLLDFGAARYSLGDKSQSLDVVLKHGFAPKEQYVRRGRQGAYTDVYALGATFYFALTGKRPPDSIDRMDQDNLVPPSSLGVQIPQDAEKAILMALGVRPEDRFQTMQAFKSAMGVVPIGNSGISPTVSQRFFTAPEQPVSSPTPMNTATIPQQNTGYQTPVNQATSAGSGIWAFLETNIEKIRIAAMATLALTGIYKFYVVLTYGDSYYWELKFQLLLMGISLLILAFSIFKSHKKLYNVGFVLFAAGFAIWVLVTIGEYGISFVEERLAYFLGMVLQMALFILLFVNANNKPVNKLNLYVLSLAGNICFLIHQRQSLLWEAIECIALLSLIAVTTSNKYDIRKLQ